MSDLPVRALAARILARLVAGNGSLGSQLGQYQDHDEFPLLQEICFGSCRWYPLLERLLAPLLRKPLKKKDSDIHCLLLAAIYQLRELRNPEYATINETVNAVAALGKDWARGLVNGVLRNYQRQQAELEARAMKTEEGETAHPAWLLHRIRQQWPAQAEAILACNNQRPPLSLRVNLARQTRDQAAAALMEVGLESTPGSLAPSCLVLHEAVPVAALPGFFDGMLSVQDEASQLVPSVLQAESGQRILDACAAPGGKLCHMLESECLLSAKYASINALDIDAGRNTRIQENLGRLGLEAEILTADALELDAWWDGQTFDRILLDAPCSGTGVIRRHPDIKLLRGEDSLVELQHRQLELLTTLWQCLDEDGLLLYTTCSILQEENEQLIERFLDATDNAKNAAITADWGVECRYGRQLLPETSKGPDGFYFCLLSKS